MNQLLQIGPAVAIFSMINVVPKVDRAIVAETAEFNVYEASKMGTGNCYRGTVANGVRC